MKASPRRLFVWAAAIGLFLDQLTKLLVQGAYMAGPPGTWRTVRLIGEYLMISPTRNPDGLFSMNYGPRFMYFVLPLLGCALVTWFAWRSRYRLASLAYGMILAGALGNLVDRARLGWVLDFIDFRLPSLRFRWFIFNLADAFIVVGIIGLLAWEFFGKRTAKEPGGQEAGKPDPAGPEALEP
ncbi:MAG: signal peptidase II [bacterium]